LLQALAHPANTHSGYGSVAIGRLDRESREGEVPRFHFNVHDGSEHPDLEGAELPGLSDARKYAVRYFRDMLHSELNGFWAGEEWKMEVTDDTGLLLFSLHFSGTDSPALSRPDLTILI
jgi:hypothetical protein